MPLVDKPLVELLSYQGINPKPDDHDEYWARAIDQMHQLGTECELIPASFQVPGVAKCYDMYFVGVGGAKVHAKLLVPEKTAGKLPAVLQFHGYSGNCGDWSGMLNFVAAGFVVAGMDARGQGGSSEDSVAVKGNTLRGHIIRGLDDPDPDKLMFRNIYLDTAQLARIIMAMNFVHSDRVGCMGGSQGGALTIACASLEPRIARAAPMFPFLCDYKRVWEMDLSVAAYEELRTYFRLFDPLHEREEEIFTKLGYVDLQFLASRIQAEVLMFTGLMDTICPPSTQFAAYNKIASKKSVKIYPDFGHEGLPGSSDITMQFMLGLKD